VIVSRLTGTVCDPVAAFVAGVAVGIASAGTVIGAADWLAAAELSALESVWNSGMLIGPQAADVPSTTNPASKTHRLG
jgi:hypothetical protein